MRSAFIPRPQILKDNDSSLGKYVSSSPPLPLVLMSPCSILIGLISLLSLTAPSWSHGEVSQGCEEGNALWKTMANCEPIKPQRGLSRKVICVAHWAVCKDQTALLINHQVACPTTYLSYKFYALKYICLAGGKKSLWAVFAATREVTFILAFVSV